VNLRSPGVIDASKVVIFEYS